MRRDRRSQLSVGLVAVLMGLLVVFQLRAQSGGSSLEQRSAQDLTQLVANLNTRNEQLRAEITDLERQLGELTSSASRGETAAGALRTDLARLRTWSGLGGADGSGVIITVRGPIAGPGVQDLLNELRNAGSEAIAVASVRVVADSVVAGEPDSLSIENTALGDPLEVRALGDPQTLTGSLIRAGGIVAQLRATYPGLELTVIPSERVTIVATERDLRPTHASPRL